jgi:hypothetical protein
MSSARTTQNIVLYLRVLAASRAEHVAGLDARAERSSFVQSYPRLRLFFA